MKAALRNLIHSFFDHLRPTGLMSTVNLLMADENEGAMCSEQLGLRNLRRESAVSSLSVEIRIPRLSDDKQ
jgi:hypothetical protein